MLYIINIDANSFGISGAGALAENIEESYQKEYVAMSNTSVDDHEFISIKSTIDGSRLLTLANPENVNLNGTVHTTGVAFVTAFNNLMIDNA